MPLEKEFNQYKRKYGKFLFEKNNLAINFFDDGLRRFLSLESNNLELLLNRFIEFYNIYSEFSNSKIEPMMNILAVYENKTMWRVLIFLRERGK